MTVERTVVRFGLLTFALSLPFYLLHALAEFDILLRSDVAPIFIGAFTLAPITAASILTFRHDGRSGLRTLIRRAVDHIRIVDRRWYGPILLLLPALQLLALGILWLFGETIPSATTPALALPGALVLFLILGTGEEVGWMGFAFEPMERTWGALEASVVLGTYWALWHLPFFVFVVEHPVSLIADLLFLVGMRVVLVWLFVNTGNSVFGATLAHATSNVALVTLPEIRAVEPWGSVVWCGLALVAAALGGLALRHQSSDREESTTGAA